MARLARIVIPGLPQHVTQRGNRRGRVIFRMRIISSIWMSWAPPPARRRLKFGHGA